MSGHFQPHPGLIGLKEQTPHMPKMSALNGLLVEPIPDELQLNDVERPRIFEVIVISRK